MKYRCSIRKLDQKKDNGLISEFEYQDQKAAIIAGSPNIQTNWNEPKSQSKARKSLTSSPVSNAAPSQVESKETRRKSSGRSFGRGLLKVGKVLLGAALVLGEVRNNNRTNYPTYPTIINQPVPNYYPPSPVINQQSRKPNLFQSESPTFSPTIVSPPAITRNPIPNQPIFNSNNQTTYQPQAPCQPTFQPKKTYQYHSDGGSTDGRGNIYTNFSDGTRAVSATDPRGTTYNRFNDGTSSRSGTSQSGATYTTFSDGTTAVSSTNAMGHTYTTFSDGTRAVSATSPTGTTYTTINH